MNSNELVDKIVVKLFESDIPNIVNRWLREHPEYWTTNESASKILTSCRIDIGMCVDTPAQIQDADAFLSIDLGFDTEQSVTVYPKEVRKERRIDHATVCTRSQDTVDYLADVMMKEYVNGKQD